MNSPTIKAKAIAIRLRSPKGAIIVISETGNKSQISEAKKLLMPMVDGSDIAVDWDRCTRAAILVPLNSGHFTRIL